MPAGLLDDLLPGERLVQRGQTGLVGEQPPALKWSSRGDTGMKFGLMDRAGQEVTPALYDAINWVAQGLYCGDISGGAVLLSAEGEVLNTYSAGEEGLSQ